MAERSDEFLRRWSRRKSESRDNLRSRTEAGAEGGRVPAVAEREQETEDGTETARLAEGPDGSVARPAPEKELTEEDFDHVDFDALDYNSDFQQFMGKGVPEAIQRKALRKLWQSNPLLANIDGLNDYDEDFTDAALAVDAIKTAYKVGRGYLSDEELEEMSKIGKVEADGDGSGDIVETADEGTGESDPPEDRGDRSAEKDSRGARDDVSKAMLETDQGAGSRDDDGKGSETT